MTEHDFLQWYAAADPGDREPYYTAPPGYSLAEARGSYREVVSGVEAVARTAWNMALYGKVDLVQRRLVDGGIEYLAVKRAEPPRDNPRDVRTVHQIEHQAREHPASHIVYSARRRKAVTAA